MRGDGLFSYLSLPVLLCATAGVYVAAQQTLSIGQRDGNRVMVPTNQMLNPAGQRIEFSQRPIDLSVSPRGDQFAVLVPGNLLLFSTEGKSIKTIRMNTASLLGLSYTPDGRIIAASQLQTGGNHGIALLDPSGATPSVWVPLPPNSVPAGLAFDASGANLYVALNRMNALAQVDVNSGSLVSTVDVGVAPAAVTVAPDGSRIFVANWGGRRPAAGEVVAASAGTMTLVDPRGIASNGTVSVIDTGTLEVIAEVTVGLHPLGMRLSPDGHLLAVANANSDSVSLLDTTTLRIVDSVSVPGYPKGYLGSSPTSLAFSPRGDRLYVACGGNNSVAVLQKAGSTYNLAGSMPTDWYPISVALLPAAKDAADTLLVANSKGIGSRDAAANFRVAQWRGTVNIITGASSQAWAEEVTSTANAPFSAQAAVASDPVADLSTLGIEHVFLIIKENRTYDQVLGDLTYANGSPVLTIYGASVTPNQHALARQFVTLDNFYASGTVSADGHQWLTQATATDYLERANASYPRSYPYSGDDPMAFASTGFLWNNAQDHGLSVRVFGEFTIAAGSYSHSWREYLADAEAEQVSYATLSKSLVAPLNEIVEHRYPAFSMNVPDVFRARLFLDRFKEYEQGQSLPNLIIVQLPTDHTQGTSPGWPTPSAMMADNDLAVGRIVEAISNSPAWATSAIFIVEDDAQDGVDHVDGHRTICLAASPFIRRGAVDSTQYNQTSLIRTIEELLGLPPMNKFDAAALPMRSLFSAKADMSPFLALPNSVPVGELNPPLSTLKGNQRKAALDSVRMDFSHPDAAPEEKLNKILWHAARGWKAHYPRVPHQRSCSRDTD